MDDDTAGEGADEVREDVGDDKREARSAFKSSGALEKKKKHEVSQWGVYAHLFIKSAI